ncbi:MAG: hypothetical protein GF353_18375 [Candidatus Lokiarchaeota archaeon]|nr:hypothetical protein [Candidatus Lokiarchaeota archaeon]
MIPLSKRKYRNRRMINYTVSSAIVVFIVFSQFGIWGRLLERAPGSGALLGNFI